MNEKKYFNINKIVSNTKNNEEPFTSPPTQKFNEYQDLYNHTNAETFKEKRIEEIINLSTRKISENFGKIYKIEKKHSNRQNDCNLNEIEKDVYNINKAPKNNTNLEDNLDINRISISQNSEKMSIIDFVIDSFEENKIPKFSIYKNNDLGTLNNNYKNPFIIEEKKNIEKKDNELNINNEYTNPINERENILNFNYDSKKISIHSIEEDGYNINQNCGKNECEKIFEDTNKGGENLNLGDQFRDTHDFKCFSTRSSSLRALSKKRNKKRIFEEFLTIGIENTGLEYIDDLNEMDLTPKITYNYPNKLSEKELKFNIKFLKNFCFNEGVKVRRHLVETDLAYDSCILENNFFNKPKTSFCLVQQVSPDDVLKYFIMGIKFDDFYITPPKTKGLIDKNNNLVNIFIYEKTYLFISLDPVCNLIVKIFDCLLGVKKLNFLFNMTDFASIFIKENYQNFIEENNERISKQINEILHYFDRLEFPTFLKEITFESKLNNISLKYRHPSKYEKQYLAIDFLAKRFMKYFSAFMIFKIILSILTENSFIFISNDIEILTSTVLGFSYLIAPFKWPFIIIPNLPLDIINMIESPVPFLIGILGDEIFYENMLKRDNIEAEIIYVSSKGIKYKENKDRPNYISETNLPDICDLFSFLDFSMKNLLKTISSNNSDDISAHHECIFRQIYKLIKSEIADKIYEISRIHPKLFLNFVKYLQPNYKFNLLQKINCGMLDNNVYTSNNNLEDYNRILDDIKKNFVQRLEPKDRYFGEIFSKTQIFINYVAELI